MYGAAGTLEISRLLEPRDRRISTGLARGA